MNILVHIESLVVDDRLKADVRALESAVIDAVSKAVMMQSGPQRAKPLSRQDFGDEWAGQLGRVFQTSGGGALDGAARPFEAVHQSERS